MGRERLLGECYRWPAETDQSSEGDNNQPTFDSWFLHSHTPPILSSHLSQNKSILTAQAKNLGIISTFFHTSYMVYQESLFTWPVKYTQNQVLQNTFLASSLVQPPRFLT